MKFFKLYLSNKETVIIDQEDFDKLGMAMNTGSFVKLKNAIVNPSYISHVFPISQKEALENESPERKIVGHVDEERGVYVVEQDVRPSIVGLTDKFKMP